MRPLFAALVIVPFFGSAALADKWADCSQQTDPDQSIRGCSNIIAAGRESRENLAEAYRNRSNAYDNKGDYDRAITDAAKAIWLNPELAEAYYARGVAYGRKGAYDREIADETKVIELNPKLAEAYYARGYAYGRKGDYDREIADATKAIELDPKFALAYYNRGVAHDNKGDFTRALTDFRVALQLIPASDQWHDQALARVAELEKAIPTGSASELLPRSLSK